jgi:hypothetical protein
METKKKLPVGIEKFSEFFTDDFYYVDLPNCQKHSASEVY